MTLTGTVQWAHLRLDTTRPCSMRAAANVDLIVEGSCLGKGYHRAHTWVSPGLAWPRFPWGYPQRPGLCFLAVWTVYLEDTGLSYTHILVTLTIRSHSKPWLSSQCEHASTCPGLPWSAFLHSRSCDLLWDSCKFLHFPHGQSQNFMGRRRLILILALFYFPSLGTKWVC